MNDFDIGKPRKAKKADSTPCCEVWCARCEDLEMKEKSC